MAASRRLQGQAADPSGRVGSAAAAPLLRRYTGRIVLIAVLLQAAVIIRGADAEPSPVYTGVTSRLHSLSSITLTSNEHADHPELALVSAMVPWQALESSDDVFDWSRLDADVRDARDHGYRVILRVMAGRSAPSWLWAAGVASIPLLGTDQNAVDFCDRIRTSLPWDPVLEAEYTEMMGELGRWMSLSDGAGGTNGDHVYLVPVSMPSILGTEMVYGYGPNVRCPAGTDGAGTDLAVSNRAAWDRISTETQRRGWVASAWMRAIDVHMRQLPARVNSVIAFGSVFGDGHAASMKIAAEKIPQYAGRLWGMYTNLQPEVAFDGSLSPYRVACSRCDAVIRQTVASGGSIGFQVAGGPVNDPVERFRYSVRDALANYPTRFIETSPGRIDQHQDFLLTGADPVQDQLAQLADPTAGTGTTNQGTLETVARSTQVEVRCERGVVGRSGACTATVTDMGGAGAITPGGTDSIAWSTSAAGVFSSSRCTPAGADGTATCAVEYTPGEGSAGFHGIAASYAGSSVHAPSNGALDLEVGRRGSATSVACDSSAILGRSTTCTARVDDVDAGQVTTPSGTVAFAIEGGDSLGACTLEIASDGRSRCSFDVVAQSVGTIGIVAEYTGDADHVASAVDQPSAIAVEPVADTQAPAVAITRPVDGSSVKPRKVTIAAAASDDVAIVRVLFAVNGQTLCEDTTAAWSCSWRVPNEAGAVYTVTATAFDAAGNASAATVVVAGR